ncbi:ribosome small subunit-dependent GTPase A [Planctomicrobium sp. SH664]|uniref:ribosome small subunit-dependent GTPase A n=1 Tax=Planctomicrobium sp. SH664 TaxID=3448125 RepID=UPI003F5C0566
MAAAKKQGKKVRLAFKKNRGNRTRHHDLTRQAQEVEDLADLSTGERLSGKGELTRHRTILTEEDGSSELTRVASEQDCLQGRVLAAVGANQIRVQAATGEIFLCSVRRLVRTLLRETRSAVVAGDRVLFAPEGTDAGVIERVEPRSTVLSRGSRRYAHVIVANVEQAVIVASVNDPPLKPGLIDRFLCSVEKGGIRGIVCLNKADLGDQTRLQPIIGQYAQLGYETLLTNALTGAGLPQLRRLLRNRETVFTGQSGVGKSSLLNAVQPGLGRSVGDVSSDSGKGRHTTRVTELLPLEGGGWVVDTPGIRQLQLWNVSKPELEGLFIEFRPYVPRCRFPDCLHLHEHECGVQAAVAAGRISPLRYESYRRIMNDEED